MNVFVYRNGMTGSEDGGDLEILYIDVVYGHRDGRNNKDEANTVAEFWGRTNSEPSSVAVLTSYTI